MMTKRNFSIPALLLGLTIGLWAGCGDGKIPQGKFTEEQMSTIPLTNRYMLPEPTGGMVFSVDTETLTADQMILPMEEDLRPLAERLGREEFTAQVKPVMLKAIRSRVTYLLLYKEARKNAPENIDDQLNKAVEKEVDRFVAAFGNDFAEAQRQLKKEGRDWKSFREDCRKEILTQSYLSSELLEEKTFSREELLNLYEEAKEKFFHRPGEIEFRLIDLQPQKLTAEQIGEGETRIEAARRLGREILARLEAGEDFAMLARTYSHGPMASEGGLWRPVTVGTDSLAEPYDVIEERAKDASRGDLIGPIEVRGHLFIIRVENNRPEVTRSFEEVQGLLENELRVRHRRAQQDALIDKLIQRADLLEMDRFADFCVREAYRRWGAALK